MYYFSKSSKGYCHIASNTVCQDFSSAYHDEERTIVSVADGHGGKVYIRSNKGSRFASMAVNKVFSSLSKYSVTHPSEDLEEKIKLSILCEWNRLVEEDCSRNPIKKEETEGLNEDERYELFDNKVRAYGTTLIGAAVIGNKLVVAHLGDGECLLVKNGKIVKPFEEDDDEPVANVTYSMCGDNVISHMNVRILNFDDYDGVLLCSDGLVNPYQNYSNFEASFVRPVFNNVLTTGELGRVGEFVEVLASKAGIGDDVSLAFIMRKRIRKWFYKQ